MPLDISLEEGRLAQLIKALQVALKLGYSSSSSPVESLLNGFIDLCLLLGRAFKEGSLSIKTNPGIKTLGSRDELGNPKMIKVFQPRHHIGDPQISRIFRKLSLWGVKVKQGQPGNMPFIGQFAKLFRVRQPPAARPKRNAPTKRSSAPNTNWKQKNYWRRKKRARRHT